MISRFTSKSFHIFCSLIVIIYVMVDIMERVAETPLEYFICGGLGGLISVFVGHPFDTIKLRLQTLPKRKSQISTYSIIEKIMAKEGVLGLYKGLMSPLMVVVPLSALSFCSYKIGKLMIGPPEHHLLNYKHYLFAGSFAGLCASFIQAPGDRIKCLLQMQQHGKPKKYLGVLDAIEKLYKEGGVRNLYQGLCATLLKEIPGSGVYFLTYECIRDALTNDAREPTTFGIAIISGGTAGITYAITCSPFDVVKSRVQSSDHGMYPRGMRDVFPELLRHEGIRGFTRGLTPIILRAFPANAACFLGFEYARQIIRELGKIEDVNNSSDDDFTFK